MAKSPDAFRTISEVADWLGVQAHVLRFWESKFAQVKPIKRAGGRRYYRPSDMLLLGGLKRVLHEDGLTIKGAQKMLREKGVGYVADLSQPLDDLTIAVIEGTGAPADAEDAVLDTDEVAAELLSPVEEVETAAEPGPAPTPEAAPEPEPEPPETTALPEPPEPDDAAVETGKSVPEAASAQDAGTPDEATDPPAVDETDTSDLQSDLPLEVMEAAASTTEPEPQDAEPAPMVSFRARPRDVRSPTAPEADAELHETSEPVQPSEKIDAEAPTDDLPSPAETEPKPQRIDVTLVHDHTTIEVAPSALSALSQIRKLKPEHASDIRPLLARLTRLRASMASPRKDMRKD
ncbi:MAG: MerR family transcriptional regulator [Roseobacter sp.]|jgi:DNA-binding transcriptional MerR regulator|nr:MerR family transcriptional regulator [Roseobacter sp.]